MQTYTHFVMTAILNRSAKSREVDLSKQAEQGHTAINRLPPVNSFWLMVGSVLPDVPLILITFGALALDLWNGNRLDPGNEAAAMQSYTGYLFRYAFFNDPWIKLAHNLFHGPLLVLFYGFVGYWLWKRGGEQIAKRGAAFFWLALACGLHTAIDIPLHYDDGPLVFFPFDWQTRVYSPVSYWDPERYGRPFAIFEHLLLLGMLIFLLVDWWRRRQARRTAATTAT